jgi:hypothetical protein
MGDKYVRAGRLVGEEVEVGITVSVGDADGTCVQLGLKVKDQVGKLLVDIALTF